MSATREVSLEVIDLVIWWVGIEHVVLPLSDLCDGRHRLGDGDCFPKLPVGLAVKLVGSDENGSILLSGVEEDAVCWEPLILAHLDDVAHFQLS